MGRKIPLGRIAGVRLGASWTWLLIFALVTWSLAAIVFPSRSPGLSPGAYWAMGVVAAVLFFGCIVLHELGHALQARRDGVEIEAITLWLLGGVAQLRGTYPTPGAELRIAVAGPAVTLVIAAVLLAGGTIVPLPEGVGSVVLWLGYINLVLLVFNLLPAMPLDGGRMLHALMWRLKGDVVWATKMAAGVGVAFGWVLVAGGLLLLLAGGAVGALWLALIGWFITIAARVEAGQALARRALRGLRVRDVMSPDPVVVPSGASLQTVVDEFATDDGQSAYPVVDDQRPLGLLPSERVTATPRDELASRRVRDAMVPFEEVAVLGADQDAADALDKIAGSEDRLLVVDDARLVGVVAPADLARAIQTAEGASARDA